LDDLLRKSFKARKLRQGASWLWIAAYRSAFADSTVDLKGLSRESKRKKRKPKKKKNKEKGAFPQHLSSFFPSFPSRPLVYSVVNRSHTISDEKTII
jgi:hypothetical protein